MSHQDSLDTSSDAFAIEKEKTKQAESAAKRTKSITNSALIAVLIIVMAIVFIYMLATKQDPSLIKWAGGGMVLGGFFAILVL